MPDLQPVAAAIAGVFLAMALTGQWLTLPVRLSLRYATTVTREERAMAKRQATAWWDDYREQLHDAAFAATCEYRARRESDPAKRAAWRLIARTRTCTGDTR